MRHDRRRPAEPAAASRHDARVPASSHDLLVKRRESLRRANGEAAGADAQDRGSGRDARGIRRGAGALRTDHPSPRPSPLRGEGVCAEPSPPEGERARVRGQRDENTLHVARSDAPVAGAIHLDHGRHRAVEGAVVRLERHVAARAGVQRLQQIEPAADPARHARADAHDPLARLGQPEFRVVRGDAVRLGERHAQMRGDLSQRIGGDPAQLVLDGVERGQEPGALPGEALGRRRASRSRQSDQRAEGTGSAMRASAKPFLRRRHESQRPQARPSGSGS